MKSSVLDSESRKRTSISKKGEPKRKRTSEPRPHPPDCLNKRYWDDVRAGRIPEPHWNSPKQKSDTKLPSYFLPNQTLHYGSHLFPQPSMNLFPPFNPASSFPLIPSINSYPPLSQQNFGFNSKPFFPLLPESICLPEELPNNKLVDIISYKY